MSCNLNRKVALSFYNDFTPGVKRLSPKNSLIECALCCASRSIEAGSISQACKKISRQG